MPLSILENVEDDGLLSSPHDWSTQFAHLVDLDQELDHDLRPKVLEALVCFLRESIVLFVVDKLTKDGHPVVLDTLRYVQLVA